MDCLEDLIELVNLGNLSALEKVLENGFSVDAQDGEGTTLLQVASANGLDDIISYLLAHNASVDLTNAYGWTPLMLASRYGHVSAMTILLKHHAKVNISNRLGLTPITAAVFSGQISAVKLLLEAGAIVGYVPVKNTSACFITALMVAALFGYESIVHFLLKKGAHVDCALNITGWTPLMMSSCSGYEKVVLSLIEHGADITKVDICQKTALEIASINSHKEVKSYLEIIQPLKSTKSKCAQEAKFMKAIQKDNLADIKTLLENDPSCANAKDPSDGISALMLASIQGFYDIAEILIQNKADVNTQDLTDGWTALMHAVFRSHIDIVKLLLDNGADVYIRATNGYTVLDLITYMEKDDKLTELLTAKVVSNPSYFSRSDSVASTFLAANIDKKNLSHLYKSSKNSSSSSPSARVKGWFSNKFRTVLTKSSSRRSNSVSAPEVKLSASSINDDVFGATSKRDELTQVKLSLSALKSPNRFLAQELKKLQVEPINPPFLNRSISDDDITAEMLELKKGNKNKVVTLFTPHLLKDYTHNNPNIIHSSKTVFDVNPSETKDLDVGNSSPSVYSKQEESNEELNIPKISIDPPMSCSSSDTTNTPNGAIDFSLSQILEKKSLGHHIPKFKEQEIDIDAFTCLKEDDFVEIGIDNSMSREALREILSNLKRTTDV